MRALITLSVLLSTVLLSACALEVPTEEIATLDGTPATLNELVRGRPAVINFWAASCIFCKDELPHFEEMHRTYPDIAVIGINLQETKNQAATYWQEGGYSFPSLLDPNGELRVQFDVFTRPTTFFVDATGEVVHRSNGPLSLEDIARYTKQLLPDGVQKQLENAATEPVEPNVPSISESITTLMLARWYGRTVKHLIPLEEILSGGPPKDGIPSIDEPKFLLTDAVDFLADDDVGILLSKDGVHKFYPYDILNWHEIVNDTIAGEDVVVSYCPLCATGIVYSGLISEGEVDFGVSGLLYQSNLLMYDRATDSLWNQVTGQAVVGPLVGEYLAPVPSNIVRYSTAKTISRDLLVLSTDTGFSRDYGQTPYAGYEDSTRTYFPVRSADDKRLHPKELVYGIVINGQATAITAARLEADLRVAGDGFVLSYNPTTEAVTLEAEEGVVPVPIFWFSWLAMFPETELID